MHAITASVQRLYETHPYPHYPLLLPLKWQEGIWGASDFARRVVSSSRGLGTSPVDGYRILLAGCGDTQAYIFNKLEPQHHRLVAVDLSRRSIERSRKRVFPTLRSIEHHVADLDDFLVAPHAYHHIDCFGVLHHLANPSQTIKNLYQALAPGGTLRLMVYNAMGRRFVRDIQKGLRILGLNQLDRSSLLRTRQLLIKLCALDSDSSSSLSSLRRILTNDSMFADTLCHPREVNLPLEYWFLQLRGAGFEVCGLLDRYGELDYFVNPMLQIPDVESLSQAASEGRFCGNLELYAWRPSRDGVLTPRRKLGDRWHRLRIGLRQPPAAFFAFPETSSLGLWHRQKIWQGFLSGGSGQRPDSLGLSPQQEMRLSRLGAFLPSAENGGSISALSPTSLMPFPSADDELMSSSPRNQVSLDQIINCCKEFCPEADPKKAQMAALRFMRSMGHDIGC